MVTAQCQNYRTLKKSIEIVAEILSFEKITLDPTLIPSLVAFEIEAAEGKLKEIDFYNFDEIAMMVLSNITKKTKQQGEPQSDRKDFHHRYFGNKEGYHFVHAFYDRIKYGYFDKSALIREINPEPPTEDSFSSTLSFTQSREWWFLTDKEYEEWIEQIKSHLFSNDAISTAKLVKVIVYLKYASDRSGVTIQPATYERIRERLKQNALSVDESFTNEMRLFLSEAKSIWEPYLQEYDEKARSVVIASLIPPIIRAIENEDLKVFLSHIIQKPKGILAAVSEKSLLALKLIFFKNRLFFNDAISTLFDQLLTYRGSIIIQDVDQQVNRVRGLITDLLTSKDAGNADRQRLKMLLDKFPPIDQECPK
jgi:hypothetical protein